LRVRRKHNDTARAEPKGEVRCDRPPGQLRGQGFQNCGKKKRGGGDTPWAELVFRGGLHAKKRQGKSVISFGKIKAAGEKNVQKEY